jgi:arginine N-succinyltransferase
MSLDHALLPPYLLRPALPTDLEALERLARASAIGISSLPPDRAALQDKLERSTRSFACEDEAVSGEELYLFVLEDRARDGLLIGTCGIEAQPGFQDRFYSYRNEFIVQVSPELGTRNRTHTLHLCHDLTGVTLLTGFHIDAAYEQTLAPQLLSRARLLFISQYAARFSDRIAAENPGPSDESGGCPFWDAVGRRFFNMDYPSAEALNSGRNKSYIAELMPQSPIYVPLLDEPAQWALGQLHEVGELPFSILLDEGFDADTYINIFDGGPTVEGRLTSLKTVRTARLTNSQTLPEMGLDALPLTWQLASHAAPRCRDFRAALLPASHGRPCLDEAAAGLLGVEPGALLRVADLDAQGGSA